MARKSIAVILISHNYGRFLSQAIDSVLAQQYAATEILVVDDCSTDDTRKVASSYADLGVKYLHIDKQNVHLARKAGFDATSSDFVCFVDADDELSRGYLADAIVKFDSDDVAVVYSDVEKFGAETGRSNYPDRYSRGELYRDNFIHAGSLARRLAINSSNVFELQIDPLITQGDWFLWRRVLRGNWTARKQKGLYRYRQHEKNWSAEMEKVRPESFYFDYAGLSVEDITIFVPLSGRKDVWPEFAAFLERQEWPHSQCRLIFLDTSDDTDFNFVLKGWISNCDYADVRVIKQAIGRRGLADANRRDIDIREEVVQAMYQIYNRMIEVVETEYIWVIEDDVLPSDDCCRALMSGFDETTGTVAAPYRSRFHTDYVVWNRAGEAYSTPGAGLQNVGGNGFGCIVLRKSLLDGHIFGNYGDTVDFDVAFYKKLERSKYTAKVDWSCHVTHRNACEGQSVSSPVTGCQCAEPGFCDRHQCVKTDHWYYLCQTRKDYYRLWEDGNGPGQATTASATREPGSQEPGLLKKAKHFSQAVFSHMADGMNSVTDEQHEERIAACRGCEYCDCARMVCRHASCGCNIQLKARWRSQSCPVGKWMPLS